jgi:hypothetical protein
MSRHASCAPRQTLADSHWQCRRSLRNEEVSGLRPAIKDVVRDTAWRRPLPPAAIRSWFRCPGRASYLVKAAYPVVITAIIWSAAKTVASSSSMAPNHEVGHGGDDRGVTAALPPVLEPIEFEVRLLHARLDRAEEHYRSFGRIWAEYLDQRPHALERTVDSDGTIVARLRRATPIPAELSVVFGELLYELRAALDNCLYAVAVLVSGRPRRSRPRHRGRRPHRATRGRPSADCRSGPVSTLPSSNVTGPEVLPLSTSGKPLSRSWIVAVTARTQRSRL